MENNTIELSLMEPEERELVTFIYNAIPTEDRGELSADDILLVLDLMDDYLEEKGLLVEDSGFKEVVLHGILVLVENMLFLNLIVILSKVKD